MSVVRAPARDAPVSLVELCVKHFNRRGRRGGAEDAENTGANNSSFPLRPLRFLFPSLTRPVQANDVELMLNTAYDDGERLPALDSGWVEHYGRDSPTL
jgi:hypothetical protein